MDVCEYICPNGPDETKGDSVGEKVKLFGSVPGKFIIKSSLRWNVSRLKGTVGEVAWWWWWLLLLLLLLPVLLSLFQKPEGS